MKILQWTVNKLIFSQSSFHAEFWRNLFNSAFELDAFMWNLSVLDILLW